MKNSLVRNAQLCGIAITMAAISACAAENVPLSLPEGFKVINDVSYVTDGQEGQKLDIYMPVKPAQARPVIIFIHGGGWSGGDKSEGTLQYYFLTKGYSIAYINYRLSTVAPFPAQIEDCKAAVRWLRAHAKEYSLDADHFIAWGGSAGGQLAGLVGASASAKVFEVGENLQYSSAVSAVCDWFGPMDMTEFVYGRSLGRDTDRNLEKLFGGDLENKKELVAKASPINYINKNTPPFLIVHGDQDPIVPVQQSRTFYDALQKAGIPSKLIILEGGQHGTPVSQFKSPEALKEMAAFLAPYAGNTITAP